MDIKAQTLRGITYGLSSMGFPNASLEQLVSLGGEFNLDFVEVRALGNSIDLPAYFEEHLVPANLSLKGPPVRLVATDLALREASDPDIEHFLRYIDIAALLGAPYVRIFGGGGWGETFSTAQWKHAAKVIARCREGIVEKGVSCDILLETHSAFSSSEMCLRLCEYLESPIRILWDSHHTWRNAGESPAETWAKIGSLIRHIHFSDSRLKLPPMTGYTCTLPGTGEYPVETLRELLAKMDFCHGVSLEWEKIWHPELPDVRLALAQFQSLLIGPRSPEQGKAFFSMADETSVG